MRHQAWKARVRRVRARGKHLETAASGHGSLARGTGLEGARTGIHAHDGGRFMAAVWAIVAVVAVFGLLNLVEYKRID
jgi:hypothetical protein